MTWQPLLDGDLADDARLVIQEIRSALLSAFPPTDIAQMKPKPVDLRMTSFEAGRGAALLLEHYCRLASLETSGSWDLVARDECVEVARWLIDPDNLASPNVLDRPPLGIGPIGTAWNLVHMGQSEGVEDIVSWADERVIRLVRAMPWSSDYDLVVGLVGLGTYALERLPNRRAVETLVLIVERLADLAEHYPDGLAWRTWPEMIIGHADSCPIGRYDLGMAHGVAGVIGFLGHVAARGIATDRVDPLLRGAVSWLLARKKIGDGPFQFFSWTQPDADPRPARLAWCYGDLGISLALLAAARGLGEPAWESEAIELAQHAAAIDPRDSGVVDAPFCHGAVGVAHCFNRLAQTTSDALLKSTAEQWFERGLRMRRLDLGIAGFSAMDVTREGQRRRVTYRGLLQGASGIGLALAAAVSEVESEWDRVMLIGPP